MPSAKARIRFYVSLLAYQYMPCHRVEKARHRGLKLLPRAPFVESFFYKILPIGFEPAAAQLSVTETSVQLDQL